MTLLDNLRFLILASWLVYHRTHHKHTVIAFMNELSPARSKLLHGSTS